MASLVGISLSLILILPHHLYAEQITPRPDIRLNIFEPRFNLIEFEVCDENDQVRLLAGQTFTKGLLKEIATQDLSIREDRQKRLRYYRYVALTVFAFASFATGMEISSILMVNKDQLNEWAFPVKVAGTVLAGSAYFWTLFQNSRENRAISDSLIFEQIFQRKIPRKHSEFVKFLKDLESALKRVSKIDCADSLAPGGPIFFAPGVDDRLGNGKQR